MKKLSNIIYKRHCLLVHEDNVKDVLYVITRETHRTFLSNMMENMMVGPWFDGSADWFVHFTCNNNSWNRLVKKLSIVQVKSNNPSKKGKVYETVD